MFAGAAPRHYRSGTSSPSGTGAITQLPAVGGGRGQGPGLRAPAGMRPLGAPGDLKEQNWSISF